MPSPNPQRVLSLSCPDAPGIVHAVSGAIARAGGNIVESQQFGDPSSGRFFMRVQMEAVLDGHSLGTAISDVAADFAMDWNLDTVGRPTRTLIMVSKAPHCLHDLLYRRSQEHLPIDVAAVVSNHTDLAEVAAFYSVPFHHLPVTPETRGASEEMLLALIRSLDVELVVLARYMQILSARVCDALPGRVINIHHSFLPSFKGARPYVQAYRRGVKLIGATAHYVTTNLDEGPIIEQDVERVTHADHAAELVALGEDVERRALARAVRWHAEHRILINDGRTVVFR
ncbi:MAG: formyltetrahydrofolate deformylase [Bifidobacteriaceae bacterium]|jgi:formyltetrahydrofolate deformylase|nr:formyltetrahydrofolate deformylase [Bifidobacteriaceae bacterium]